MRRLLPALLVALALAAGAAADKPNKAKGKGKKGGKGRQTEAAAVEAGFGAGLRADVRVYFVETHGRGKCPPGLARKNDACLPPGQAKKRYVVGQPLAPDIRLDALPAALEVRIGAPPAGYRYAIVDGDLVKLVVGTLLVVDAIGGLVD